MNRPETVPVGRRCAIYGRYSHAMSSRRPPRIAALSLVVGLAIAACGGSDAAGDDAAAVPEPAEQVAAPGSDGSSEPADDTPEILRFTSPLVGGGELDAASLSGKPTAFWFWSPT